MATVQDLITAQQSTNPELKHMIAHSQGTANQIDSHSNAENKPPKSQPSAQPPS